MGLFVDSSASLPTGKLNDKYRNLCLVSITDPSGLKALLSGEKGQRRLGDECMFRRPTPCMFPSELLLSRHVTRRRVVQSLGTWDPAEVSQPT